MVTDVDLAILKLISQYLAINHGPLNIHDIADSAYTPASRIEYVVAKLKNQGYLAQKITLTDKGKEAIK